MVDQPTADKPDAGRLRKLTRAALNADATIEQAERVLADMHVALQRLDQVFDRFEGSLTDFDGAVRHLAGAVDSVQQTERNISDVVTRIERIVDTVEKILSPALAVRGGVARLLGPVRRRPAGR